MSVFNFSDLNQLKVAIEEDLKENDISSSRYPVRFIFLNSHDELKELVDLLTDNSANLVELSSLLHSPSTWFSEDEIIKELTSIDETSVIIPLSEFIRFSKNEGFKKVLDALAEIEDTPEVDEYNEIRYKGKKLYVPLVGLWERFEDLFLDKFHRESEWAPIWKLNTDVNQIKIYQVGFKLDDKVKSNDFKLVQNSEEWFELWKTEGIKKIISLVTPVKIYFKNSVPDQTFTQELLENPKVYLSKIFNMDIDIEFNSYDEDFWMNLLIDVSILNKKNLSLKDVFIKKFNINNIDALNVCDYLNYYLKSPDNSYDKWIVKNTFLDSKQFKDSYLFNCFTSLQKLTNKNISDKIFLNIFNLKESRYLNERRDLLKKLSSFELSFPENEFNYFFDGLTDFTVNQKLSYLTNTTYIEKRKILDILQEYGVDNNFLELKFIFPELYYYLNWNFKFNDSVPSWVNDYFKEYNNSKVYNKKSEKLTEILDDKNNLNNFYEWYYSLSDINLTIDENDYVVWVDALGAEWLPLLTYCLNKFGAINGKKVQSKYIKSVNLPSSTSFNKLNSNKKISSLDNYIHRDHYNYPNSLLDELDLIEDIAKEISKINENRIIIVSDHGFSFLCTSNFGNYKKYDFDKSRHKGRYMLAEDNNGEDNNDYIFHETESADYNKERYIVALNHISLYNTPSYEVHGGATPEEVLVPYIVFENDTDAVEYVIKPLMSEINTSKDTNLLINIYPKPIDLPIAIYNNKLFNVTEDDENYIIHVDSSLNKGKQNILVRIGDYEELIEIKVNKGGMTSNDDDWF